MRRGSLILVSLAVAFAVVAVAFPAKGGASNLSKVKVGPNIDISNLPRAQFEPAIAINPNNPSEIVAGSCDRSEFVLRVNGSLARAYFSSDGGATWGSTALPRPPLLLGSDWITQCDPGLAWDTRGNVYFSQIVLFRVSGTQVTEVKGVEIGVDRSSDGGLTWTPTYFDFHNGSSESPDFPMIAIDTNPTSQFRDTIYVEWTEALGPPGVLVSRSTDFGATFSTPVSPTGVPPVGGVAHPLLSSVPFIGPDGTLYVTWQDLLAARIVVASSRDGGLTFGPVATVGPAPQSGAVAIPAENFRLASINSVCGADTSNGPRRGTLYCSWMDTTPSNGTDIFEAHSTSHGRTWSAPVRVNDDPPGIPNDQFNQWLSVDPTDGSVSMSWDDTRNDPTHNSTDVFYARSTDGGLTFSPNVQVTTAPTNLACSTAPKNFTCTGDISLQYADFAGIAAFGGVAHPVWTDMRASVSALKQEIFTTTITVKGS